MNKDGTIIIIEDDKDDQFVLEEVFGELGYPNKRMYFSSGLKALDFLYSTSDRPFLIISDINLPELNGLELRSKIQQDADLNLKCIPYIYFTTALNQQVVIDAYSTSAQGFFVKPGTYEEIKEAIDVMIKYWKKCAAPNNF
ncbi:response regulator [Dyadobacter chenwenxiniae]|uniref:Response regulator n=1 Tax=Dyadobacter chenwenxiniae TaxID=2906456 RepID=A0A9X1TK04_9BACT|nr:response regulator [Dyadobacter chenwenxiniae]MCF0051533.1 response regulator [Dyadobacter chenwenxiniae]MCF0060703.1 response regulator [Dyadobacter chenwenxiniae]UON80537.1 response regulator [Dyadobacter chenwenxiniae]